MQLGSGISNADVTVARADDGRDLVLILNATGDQLTLDNTIVGGGERVEYVRFADGMVWDHSQLMMLSNPSSGLMTFGSSGWEGDAMQAAVYGRSIVDPEDAFYQPAGVEHFGNLHHMVMPVPITSSR